MVADGQSGQVALCVIAKAPVPGRVKTRLVPPLSHEQAALVAGSALEDTLDAVDTAAARLPECRKVLYLDGDPHGLLREGWEHLAQRRGGLGERLDTLFEQIGGPAVVIGMDTPQVEPRQIHELAAGFSAPEVEAVLGPAADGGYWAIGFRSHVRGAFDGVPMSEEGTGEAQLRRLAELGLVVRRVEELRDLDHWEDAVDMAAGHPELAVSSVVSDLMSALATAASSGRST